MSDLPPTPELPYTGPWLEAAVICDRWLTEQDGVISIIRVIDQINLAVGGPDLPAEMPEGQLQLKMVVLLRSGEAKGRHPFQLIVELPSGQRLDPQGGDLHFTGEERGVNLLLDVQTPAVEGLYWIDIIVSGKLLTRVPLRLNYARLPGGG